MPISLIPAAAVPFNPHSPGPIGDVTPDTVASTALLDASAKGVAITDDASSKVLLTATGSGMNGMILLGESGFTTWRYNGSSGAWEQVSNSANPVSWPDGKISFAGAIFHAFASDGVTPAPIKGLITTAANASTGLVAGALAALTNASLVIYDGAGTAYRVPCVTP